MSALPTSACSNTTIQGSYGFLITGANSNKLAAVVGQIIADGKGGLAGSETISNNGVISSNVALTGTYSITAACIGTATITPSGFPAAKFNLTVVRNRKTNRDGGHDDRSNRIRVRLGPGYWHLHGRGGQGHLRLPRRGI